VVDHPRLDVDGMSFVIKFWADRMCGVEDIAVFFKILATWLENVGFLGTFPPNDATHYPNPKRTMLGLNHVI